MNLFITWLIRYGHVLSAACWTGGYALLALIIIPRIEKDASATLKRFADTSVRILTYAGTFTMLFGLILIAGTRGYGHLFGSTWGTLIITAFVIAFILLGIGDGAIRPALRRLRLRTARSWAWMGFILTIIAIGIMTGAIYVP